MKRRLAIAGGCLAAAGAALAQVAAPPAPVSAPQAAVSAPPRPVAMPQQPAYAAPTSAVARTPAPPAPPMPPVRGLPPDAPKLVVNGGTYSEQRDLRMAIVNGAVVREGGSVDGVVVQAIQPEGLVLAFRGSTYHVSY